VRLHYIYRNPYQVATALENAAKPSLSVEIVDSQTLDSSFLRPLGINLASDLLQPQPASTTPPPASSDNHLQHRRDPRGFILSARGRGKYWDVFSPVLFFLSRLPHHPSCRTPHQNPRRCSPLILSWPYPYLPEPLIFDKK